MIRDFPTLVCLVLFLISNTIQLFSILNEAFLAKKIEDEDRWHALDPEYLEGIWKERLNARLLEVDISIFSALAWFSLVMPVTQAAYLLSDGGKRWIGLHISIVALVLGAAMSEVLSHVMSIGLNGTIRWMVNQFELSDWNISETGDDGVGYRVIEILYLVGNGMWMKL